MINRQDARNALENLQDKAIQHGQAMKQLEREIKRLTLALGEHQKAYQDIQDEMKELEGELRK